MEGFNPRRVCTKWISSHIISILWHIFIKLSSLSLLLTSIVLATNAAPTVTRESTSNVFVANRLTMQDFPTPLSPSKTTFVFKISSRSSLLCCREEEEEEAPLVRLLSSLSSSSCEEVFPNNWRNNLECCEELLMWLCGVDCAQPIIFSFSTRAAEKKEWLL